MVQLHQFRRLEGYLREQRREWLRSKHVRIELVRMELVRMELEKENQVIKWRGGHRKGLEWLWEHLDVVGGMYNRA